MSHSVTLVEYLHIWLQKHGNSNGRAIIDVSMQADRQLQAHYQVWADLLIQALMCDTLQEAQ